MSANASKKFLSFTLKANSTDRKFLRDLLEFFKESGNKCTPIRFAQVIRPVLSYMRSPGKASVFYARAPINFNLILDYLEQAENKEFATWTGEYIKNRNGEYELDANGEKKRTEGVVNYFTRTGNTRDRSSIAENTNYLILEAVSWMRQHQADAENLMKDVKYR